MIYRFSFVNSILCFLILFGNGCGHAQKPAEDWQAGNGFPLALRGANAEIQLDFDLHPAMTVPYDLAPGEFCYMPLGEATLICTEEGSYLLFGPEDGVVIVRDNPLYQLRPMDSGTIDAEFMRGFGTIFLVTASVDRLPDALNGYLQDPGPHRRQALALARKLLADNGGVISGASRGGTFAVGVRYNFQGRAALMDAVQSDDNPREIYRVGNKSADKGDFPLIKHRFSAAVRRDPNLGTNVCRVDPGS